jgi:DNA-binding transcriptional ArsR family regulator
MSGSEEDTYSMIFTSLKHPIRRGILRILSDNPQSFSDMQRLLKIESSHLTYHLEGLGSLLVKTEEGKYALSSLGEAAASTMKRVEEPPKAYPSLTSRSGHSHLTHLLSSNKSLPKILLIIGIALLASSFLFFYVSSTSDYDHVTTYNYCVNLDTSPFIDTITNISFRATGYEWAILLQPHDYLTVRVENLPANGTADIRFEGFQLDNGESPTNLTLTDYFSLERSSKNGFLDFRNALPTEIWGNVFLISEISQTYFITMTLHHYETVKWPFFGVGVVLASLGLVTVFKSKR